MNEKEIRESVPSGTITVLTAVVKPTAGGQPLQPKATGKVLTLQPDGKVVKQAANSAAYYAHRVVIDGLPGLSSLIETMNGSQLLLSADIRGMVDQYLMLSSKYWASLGLPAGEDHLVPRNIHGFPGIQYLAKWFNPSPFMLIEFDYKDTMPPELVPANRAAWWDGLTEAVPGLAGCGRLLVPSSSGRILTPWGWPYRPVSGIHGWVQVADPSDIQRATLVLHQRLCLAGRSWEHETTKDGAVFRHLYSMVDPTVGATARKVYSAPPATMGGLELAPFEYDCREGVVLDTHTAIPPLTVEESKAFCELSGAIRRLSGRASAPFIPGFAMDMDYYLEREGGAATTPREFHESDDTHWRLNAYWRGSESGAAYIAKRKNGSMCVYDNYGPTRHEIQQDAADVFAAQGGAA